MRASQLTCRSLLLAVLLTACGGGGDTALKPSPTPESPPTRAQALAAARAVNLVQSDLPDYGLEPARDDGSVEADDDFAACLGVPPTTDVVQLFSGQFRKGAGRNRILISSEVAVAPTRAAATQRLKGYQSEIATDCFTAAFDGVIRGELKDQKDLSISRLAGSPGVAAAEGADGAYAHVMTAALTAGPYAIPPRIEVDGFLVGRALVMFVSTAFGDTFADADRHALIATLVKRAKAAGV